MFYLDGNANAWTILLVFRKRTWYNYRVYLDFWFIGIWSYVFLFFIFFLTGKILEIFIYCWIYLYLLVFIAFIFIVLICFWVFITKAKYSKIFEVSLTILIDVWNSELLIYFINVYFKHVFYLFLKIKFRKLNFKLTREDIGVSYIRNKLE